MKKIAITGGHHSSALPVITELRRRYPEIEIVWFGHKFSAKGDRNPTLEYREITNLGIEFFELHAGKFYKTYDPIRLAKIPYGFLQAFFMLNKSKPDIILSFGGYLAVPTVIAGKVLSIPSVTHEQTVVAGYANKLISKFVDKILVSWEESKAHFKGKEVIEVGIPLRESIFESTSNKFKVNELLPTIYITTGKTGSHKINQVVNNCLFELLNNYNLIHQTGDHSEYDDYISLNEKYISFASESKGLYYPQKFIYEDQIGEAFSKADMVISRAGAHVCFELLALNKPALLIPIPWVSHNEQYENAMNLKEKGLVEILEEKDLDQTELLRLVNLMMNDLNNFKMHAKVKMRDSAKLIVDEIEKTLQEKN